MVVNVAQQPEKDLLIWVAPVRPFKRKNRDFYVTLIAIAGIVGLVLFLVEGFMPVILIISLVFLYYVLHTVEPESVEYKFTNLGIKIGNKLSSWASLGRFWFTKRFDDELLIIETAALPGRMELVVNPNNKEKIKKVLSSYLKEEEVPPSFLDKAANWISQKIFRGR